MSLDRKFLLCGLAYAIAGMCVGIYMAASKNHGQLVGHAHILLVGFVVSFIYALIHKLWISADDSTVAHIQFYLHQASALVMGVGLLMLYGGLYQEVLEKFLPLSAFGVLGSALLMVYLVVTRPVAAAAGAPGLPQRAAA